MTIEGGCYCGAVRYKAEGEPMLKAECFCREFCADCGTHLATRAPGFEVAVIVKVGTLDDPGVFGKAGSANFACDAQDYHRLPDDMPVHQKWMHD